MSTLEQFVPPLEECKKIPDGAFADSALVWAYTGNGYEVTSREVWSIVESIFPGISSPTLAEIWNELPTVWNNRFLVMLDATNRGKGHQIGYARLIDGVLDSDGDFCTQDLNPAIAALWLWFRVKGASC